MSSTSLSPQKKLLGFTIKASIVVQIITGLITLGAVFFTLKPQDMILHDIVLMETVVQFVELAFYVLISYYLVNISVSGVTPLRYFDWVFTTPTMLLSTIMFFDYVNNKSEGLKENRPEEKRPEEKRPKEQGHKEKPQRFAGFVKENKETIIQIFVFNFFMLAFGYLGEIGKMNLYLANVIGFAYFGMTFYIMWDKFVRESTAIINHQLFYFMFVVWGLYGVAALMPPLMKNIGYNFLDIVAKNFYGLFIFYQMYLLRG